MDATFDHSSPMRTLAVIVRQPLEQRSGVSAGRTLFVPRASSVNMEETWRLAGSFWAVAPKRSILDPMIYQFVQFELDMARFELRKGRVFVLDRSGNRLCQFDKTPCDLTHKSAQLTFLPKHAPEPLLESSPIVPT